MFHEPGMTDAPARPDSLAELDIVSHDVYERGVPHAAYDRFRAEAPVAWINEGPHNGHHGAGFWSLTRWADVVSVHKDWRTFSSELGGTEIEELAADALVARKTMLETDPPRHTRLRQLVNPAFAKPTMERYASGAQVLIDSLLADALADPTGDSEFDVVARLARELPIRMLVEILGVPPGDAAQLFHWADQIVYNADPDYADVVSDRVDTDPYRLLPFRSPVSLQVFEHFERLAASRRRDPAADLITLLADAVVDGTPLTERERGTFLLLLLIAGNETTRHSLTQAVIAFAEHPDQYERLRAEPHLLRHGGGGGAAMGLSAGALPAHRDRRHRDRRSTDRCRRQGGHVVHRRQLRPRAVRRTAPVRHRPYPQPPRHVRRWWPAPVPRSVDGPARGPRVLAGADRAGACTSN